MKFHKLMFMNAWMMLVLMKCKCQMQCLTLGCYRPSALVMWILDPSRVFPRRYHGGTPYFPLTIMSSLAVF